MRLSNRMRRLGWRLFYLMWLPFILIFVGMIGLPDGNYAWDELPELMRTGIAGTAILGAASMFLLVGAPVVSGLQNRSVQATGRTAEAEILNIIDTGTTVNQNPVIRFVLEVRPEGEPAFRAETERLISRLRIPQIQPGALVQVKYDPDSHHVALLEPE